MQGVVRDRRFDSLCSALDGIQAAPELVELSSALGLERVSLESSSVTAWKGMAQGAQVEILLIPSEEPSGAWTVSTLVTSGGRVGHVRRRLLRL